MSNPSSPHPAVLDTKIDYKDSKYEGMRSEAKCAKTPITEADNAGAIKSSNRTTDTEDVEIPDTEVTNTEAINSENKGTVSDSDSDSADCETSIIESADEAGRQLRNEVIKLPKVESREFGSGSERSTKRTKKQKFGSVAAGGVQEDEVIPVKEKRGAGEKIDPSEIPQELQTCIEAIVHSGTFTTCGNSSTAPNPVISIQDIGIVGLPLSSRDAAAIIITAVQASSGNGQQPPIDTNSQDVWELQPSQVQFLNPAWQTWVEKEVLVKAVNDLGVANTVNTVKCELYKVLLYKKGNQFLQNKDTEKSPGIFGTLMIILPSSYSGGVLQFSHKGNQRQFHFGGPKSVTSTSYAAWYTHVLYSISPVTSGYLFALSYNMIYEGYTAVPRLPDTMKQIQNLRQVLNTWDRSCANEQSPLVLAWVLDQHYTKEAIESRGIGALTGVDKHRGKMLLDLAKVDGFEFYLAQMEYKKTGKTDSGDHWDYGGRRYGRWGYGGDGNEIDPEELVMNGVLQESLSAHTFVNCKNGVVLSADFKPSFDKEDCLPFDYWDDTDVDSKEYDGYVDDVETLTFWYHRTAIIIWPTETHIDSIGHLADGFEAVAFLDRALWTPREIQGGWRLEFGERIVEKLCPSYNRLSTVELEYANKLMAFALEEKRLDLFLKMIGVTKSTDVLKIEESASVFGAEGVRDVVQRCIANTDGIEVQLRIAKQLLHERPEDLKFVTKGLINAISITKDVEPESFREILGLLGPDLFNDCILPNLQRDFSKTSFWILAWKHYPNSTLIRNSLPEVVHAHEVRFHHTPDRTRYTISSQTLPLFSKVVEIVRGDLAAEMIQKIQALPKPIDAESGILKGKYPDVLMAITGKIIEILRKHKVPVKIEPYTSFIKKTFLEKILPTLGPRPRPGGNFSLPKIAELGLPMCCVNCNAVDAFLADPWQQTISFNLVHTLREHLQYKLQGVKNLSIRNNPLLSRIGGSKNAVMGTITFTKIALSAIDAVEQWDKRRATMEREFIAVGDEETRGEIFGGLAQIVLMSIGEYGMGWGREMEEATIISENEEEEIRKIRLQSRARAVASAMDYHAATQSPAEGYRDVQASLGEGSVDGGKKRKRSSQVIDLTNQ